MTELKNEFYAKVTQYTYTRNGRPLRINRYEYAAGHEMWEIVDFGFVIQRCETALEVKAFLGATPRLRGAFEIYRTPIGRNVEKQIYGTRVF